MKLEAKFLVDPLKLAQAVVEKLRDSDFDAAMSLVRASEKSRDGMAVDNIVSWNHVIDWLMSKGEPSMAWKVYNEMKKRGHKPDAHTYTIMLRGYRDNVKKPNAVKQAVAVYDSISAANSVVTPTTIHTNAVLSVCARANDIESLWSIAGRLPDKGPGAPDHITFTTILQAINAEVRARAVELGSRNGPDYDPQPIFEQAVSDARKLWVDITGRWRKGNLQLDEALVCAMGRLLMLSTDPKAYEDVLNLVQQAMNIPKSPDNLGRTEDPNVREEDDSSVGTEAHTTSHSGDSNRSLVRSGSRSTQLVPSPTSIYATPGQNTLSMLLETATALRYLRAGKYYWDLLTAPDGPYKIIPDHGNVAAYLRLLRVSRASQATLDVLRMPRPKEIQDRVMVRGTFFIAMSTCLRDKNNPNVFDIASRILDLMQGRADSSDQEQSSRPEGQKLEMSPRVLTKYLELALATTNGLNGGRLNKTRNGDLDFERDPHKNNTLRALRRLAPDMLNVKRLLKLHMTELEQQAAVKSRTSTVQKLLAKRELTHLSVSENMNELVDFLRTLIGAYDKILMVNERLEDEGLGPLDRDILNECWSQKRKLSAFLGKVNNERGIPIEARREREHGSTAGRAKAKTEVSEEDFEDEAGETLDVTVPNQRTKTIKEINKALMKQDKAREESRLSRRQKRELGKEERIRRQFPVSMLKPKPSEQTRLSRQRHETGSGDRKRSTTSASQMYRGWGGGFEALAREQGQGEKAGFIDLRP
ncbi:hypothetical protein A1O1_04331 [Capronia coronata CBS 617.96]|uniref:Pentacotripeptide-repeat region of PRORP domain-containing protein n=1 Tax=Capronia coronata CBS 617.96 TaxID=1182541 RepID=W9YPP5_9EURO|nr:uncharacterized protein A1O1_04331 [Capronia coronata CBS 617.96]EXJ91221.1 hypothetical protein A1O1_04331 [Capronia coronata CBS 617.96]